MNRFVIASSKDRPLKYNAWNRRFGKAVLMGTMLGACAMLSGCAIPVLHLGRYTPVYRPENVFVSSPVLPVGVKRVAVLPLTWEGQRPDLADGCEALNAILQGELIKTKKFEVVCISPEILRSRTSRSDWTSAEVLPAEFLNSLREVYGCDAVMFCQLTVFRAYAPLEVGWRMNLIDVRTRQPLWAVDEIFNAGQQSVLHGAGDYQYTEQQTSLGGRGYWLIQNSPRRLGQYAAAQLFATLPAR